MSPVMDNLAAIVLGASREGQDPEVAARLGATAVEIQRYLSEPDGLNLPKDRICRLYDDPRSPIKQRKEIGRRLRAWATERAGIESQALAVLLFFVGHGLRGGKHVLLASSNIEEPETCMDVDVLSSRIISAAPMGSTYFLYLDCCYSTDVFNSMQFRPKGGMSQDGEQIASTEPHRPLLLANGIYALVAANAGMKAMAPPGDTLTRMSTLFFATLGATPRRLLSLREVRNDMVRVLTAREQASAAWRDYRTPQPELFVREESRLLLDAAPLFPSAWGEIVPVIEVPAKADPHQLNVVVVSRERGSLKLVNTVKAALSRLREDEEFCAAYQKTIADPPRILELNVAYAFDDEASLRTYLRALCQADLVVVDVSKDEKNAFEPGVMLLLGVRSVARRGVTICSVDTQLRDIYKYHLPYNLQYLNLSAHGDPYKEGPKLLQNKIAAGFSELERNPRYLDLPTYDSIRNLGSAVGEYEPISYDQGPLYLGPFTEDDGDQCFRRIEQELITKLEGRAKKRLGRSYTERHEPHVRRLLDREASKLVALSLYEAIRRYNFCLVDWSGLRANVFFEFGVRLAARDKGAVHILPQGQPLDEGLRQVRAMRGLFKPIVFDHADYEKASRSVQEIMDRREQTAANKRDEMLYREIAEAVQPETVEAVSKLATDLSSLADLAFLDDQDTRRTTVLFADRNQDVQHTAIATSIALGLCALTLRVGIDGDHVRFATALAHQRNRIEDLAETGANERDVEALRSIFALITDGLRDR